MCRVWMETVCGRELKDGIRYLAAIGMTLLTVRIILMFLVAVVYFLGYITYPSSRMGPDAGFIIIDLFAILAFYIIYQNIHSDKNVLLLLGITIHIVAIFFFSFFCLIIVVWIVEYNMEFLHFLLSLMLCSISMIFLVLDIYFVMACATDYSKRISRYPAASSSVIME